jgi:hypothetical protein
MRRIAVILAIAALSSGATAAAIVLPAGAGGGDDEPRTEQIEDGEQRPELQGLHEEFRSCMEDQGFTIGPDVEVEVTPDGVTLNGERVDRERFLNALNECRGQMDVPDGVPRGGFGGDGGPPGFFGPPDGERAERLRECLERGEET